MRLHVVYLVECGARVTATSMQRIRLGINKYKLEEVIEAVRARGILFDEFLYKAY